MTLAPLSHYDMEQVRLWRNLVPETLRTPFMLTEEQQRDYYDKVICDRRGNTRYWGLWTQAGFVGYGGIESIEWENRQGEISLLIGPDYRGKGYGREAVRLFLEQAFEDMNLHAVHGECYYSSPAVDFWKKLIEHYRGHCVDLPHRKYHGGQYWPSCWFIFYRENWP